MSLYLSVMVFRQPTVEKKTCIDLLLCSQQAVDIFIFLLWGEPDLFKPDAIVPAYAEIGTKPHKPLLVLGNGCDAVGNQTMPGSIFFMGKYLRMKGAV